MFSPQVVGAAYNLNSLMVGIAISTYYQYFGKINKSKGEEGVKVLALEQ